MTPIRALIFDFIGTLISVKDYSMEASKLKLHKAIFEAGFKIDEKTFLEAYSCSHEKFRVVRYQELIEVTNAVWISDALNCLGFKTNPEDACIKTAVNVFFEDYLESLKLNPCTTELLEKSHAKYKLGLISNFTFAPVIYAALRRLDINRFLNTVLVSEDVGWRKPNSKIFREALKRLGVEPQEVVYVGDCPAEDIGGAQAVGMKTIFVPSQFYTLNDLKESGKKPDLIVKNTCELGRKLPRFIKTVEKAMSNA